MPFRALGRSGPLRVGWDPPERKEMCGRDMAGPLPTAEAASFRRHDCAPHVPGSEAPALVTAAGESPVQ